MAGGPDIEKLVGAIRAQELVLLALAGAMLSRDQDPVAGARALKAAMGDKYADAPTGGKIDREVEARINHYAAHFAEEFWERIAQTLEARRTSPD